MSVRLLSAVNYSPINILPQCVLGGGGSEGGRRWADQGESDKFGQ